MKTFFSSYRGALITLLLLILMPFIVGLFDSASPATVLSMAADNPSSFRV